MNDDQFSHWATALREGRGVDTEPGNPRSGFYKTRDRNQDRSVRFDAVAIWREPDGELCCARTGRQAPTHADEIDTLFSYCAATPITHELYQHIAGGGTWPEEFAAPEPVADDKPPHEAIAAELAALQASAKEWIVALERKPQTQEEANKAGNFVDAFVKIEAKATSLHKAEKEPFLEGGRAVDAKYFPTRDAAAASKKWAKKLIEDFLIAEKARLAEEARKVAAENARRTAEVDRAKAEADKAGLPLPVPLSPAPMAAPEPAKAKAGTSGRAVSLRTRTIHEIVDYRALLMFMADWNDRPGDLTAVLQVLANRMCNAGVKVPGVETKQIQEVA